MKTTFCWFSSGIKSENLGDEREENAYCNTSESESVLHKKTLLGSIQEMLRIEKLKEIKIHILQ